MCFGQNLLIEDGDGGDRSGQTGTCTLVSMGKLLTRGSNALLTLLRGVGSLRTGASSEVKIAFIIVQKEIM